MRPTRSFSHDPADPKAAVMAMMSSFANLLTQCVPPNVATLHPVQPGTIYEVAMAGGEGDVMRRVCSHRRSRFIRRGAAPPRKTPFLHRAAGRAQPDRGDAGRTAAKKLRPPPHA